MITKFLKWFWNIDIMGKIYTTILLFIIIVTIITVVTRNQKARKIQNNNASNEIVKNIN